MKRILFIASHRFDRAPGQRFRFEQFFSYLRENGFECHLSPLVSPSDDRFIYKPGSILRKFWFFALKCRVLRLRDLFRKNQFDIIFIFREALMTRSTFFEKQFKKSRAKIVFDFDDSVWLQNVSEANRRFAWLKNPDKTSSLIAMSDLVLAGNEYLANYASRFNSNVTIVPTTIDTREYQAGITRKKTDNTICIGWSGSVTTIQHFKFILPALQMIREKYGHTVRFEVIGDNTYTHEKLDIVAKAWSKQDEIATLSGFDIGIMPLPDDEWANGKCGLKGLQYMALGIPTIMSPVGVNPSIIQDGTNGFLAASVEEWVDKLSLLIESPELRQKLGQAGRKTVVEQYSFDAWKDRYVEIFRKIS